jgi:hypothetical protein
MTTTASHFIHKSLDGKHDHLCFVDQALALFHFIKHTMALFIRLIIRLFQLVFSAETVFFSHNKSANSVFQPVYQHSRTEPIACTMDLKTTW